MDTNNDSDRLAKRLSNAFNESAVTTGLALSQSLVTVGIAVSTQSVVMTLASSLTSGFFAAQAMKDFSKGLGKNLSEEKTKQDASEKAGPPAPDQSHPSL